jgi:outer membrane immunogenic protein
LAAVSAVVLGSVAMAADLPSTKGPPVYAPPPPPFTWTGFYIGGQAGYEFGTTRDDRFFQRAIPGIVSPITSYGSTGFIGGAHAGYNFEINQFVLGVEGDVNGAAYSGRITSVDLFNPAVLVTESTRIGIQGSFRGRIGYAFDRVLIFGTGGVAGASIRSSFSDTVAPGIAESTIGRVGWTAGGGIAYAIDNNWSVGAEYRYADYGHLTYAIDATAAGGSDTKRVTTNQVTLDFSYKFDEAPPPAPPIVTKY